MFCVECGRKGKTYHGLCIDCYLKKKKFFSIPSSVEVTFCRECDSYRIGGEWKRGNLDEDLKEYIRKNIKAEIDYECTIDNSKVTCRGKFEGRDVEEEREIKIIEKERLCPQCSLKKGGYFEAIIQVRDADKEKMRKADEIIKRNVEKSKTFISRKEKVRGGYDYYLGSKKAAEHSAKEIKDMLGGEMKISSTLAGVKDGRRVYRNTYSVRFFPLVGKFVKIDEKLYMITGMEGKKLELRDMEGRRRSIYREDLKRVVNLELKVRDGRVVYEEGNYLYVMDMKNYKTVVVRKPEGWKGKKEIKIVEYEGKVYAVG